MDWGQRPGWVTGYEPHPEITSWEDLQAFHDEVSVWRQLQRQGIHPVVFAALFTILVAVPGTVLVVQYDLNHPLATLPMAAVLIGNTILTFVGLYFIDRRFPVVMHRIRGAFDMSDSEYYGAIGRMFEQLYQLSFYSPLAPGPNGREHHPAFWVLLLVTYIVWLGILATIEPVVLPVGIAGQLLLVGYFLFIVAYASISLFTAFLFLSIITRYLAIQFADFTVHLSMVQQQDRYGFKPFASFLLRTVVIGVSMAGTAGIIGLVTMNRMLLLFSSLLTPLILVWFFGAQYGFHAAIVGTKQSRLERLHEEHADQINKIFLETTPEPGLDTVTATESFVTVKDRIESLPNWPVDLQIITRAVTVTILGNLPSVISMFA